MRVVHIISGVELGGTETTLYRLLCTLSRADYEFFVVVLGETGHYSAKIAHLGIPIHYLAIKKINFIKKFCQLIGLIREIKPDVVQTWLYHADLLGGVSAKLCGVNKIIWGIRCEGKSLKRTTQWVKMLCAFLSWMIPDVILTNSKKSAQNHRRVGYNAQKFAIIPNGFDPSQFYPRNSQIRRQKIGNTVLPQDALVFGTLARFHQDKDYPTLIRAIDQVCAVHANVYFVFCGQGCHESNVDLSAKLSILSYQDRVILINGTDDSTAYLNRLDVFILASRTESFPNSLAEAMLCGLPCIATDVGEVRDILGDTGLLVPSEEPQELALACLVMRDKSPQERMHLGALARNRIEQQYSLEKNYLKISLLYEQ